MDVLFDEQGKSMLLALYLTHVQALDAILVPRNQQNK